LCWASMVNYVEFAIKTLCKLISIPTINPPGENYERVSRYLSEVLKDLGCDVELIEIPPQYLDEHYPYAPQHRGRPRYIVYAKCCSSPVLHFNAHYDVVPPGSGWSRDPFKPVVERDRVYGRGASDDKASIACMLAAIKKLVDEGIEPRIELALVPDEESGGLGTRYLVEELRIVPSTVLVGEPTSSRLVAIGHKGVLRGFLKIRGVQGHAATPWRCINAFEEGCLLISCLIHVLRESFRRIASSYPYECDEARYSTASFGGITRVSTNKENVVPSYFETSFDIRLVPEMGIDQAMELLRESVELCRERVGSRAEVELEIRTAIPPSITSPDEDIVKLVQRIAEEVLGEAPRLFVNCGRYDSVFYVLKGSRAVIYGPGAREAPHSVDEYVPLSEVEKFVEVYYRIIKELSASS